MAEKRSQRRREKGEVGRRMDMEVDVDVPPSSLVQCGDAFAIILHGWDMIL